MLSKLSCLTVKPTFVSINYFLVMSFLGCASFALKNELKSTCIQILPHNTDDSLLGHKSSLTSHWAAWSFDDSYLWPK